MSDSLNPLDFLFQLCFEAFLTFARKQIQSAHDLQLLRNRPLWCILAEWSVCKCRNFWKRIFIWISVKNCVCDCPSSDTACTYFLSTLVFAHKFAMLTNDQIVISRHVCCRLSQIIPKLQVNEQALSLHSQNNIDHQPRTQGWSAGKYLRKKVPDFLATTPDRAILWRCWGNVEDRWVILVVEWR